MSREFPLVCALAAAGLSSAQESALPPAVPVEPIGAIIEELEGHDLVAIAVVGYEEEHQLLTALLNAPEFPLLVDDIVVEFGASRYQETLDTFISGGSVPYADLKKTWQQTTQPHHAADLPIYEAFFRAVREVNSSLPPENRLRVVAAEPPIDWEVIETYEDLLPWLQQRFPYEAEVVEREVLKKGRKALLISGGLHYANGTPLLNAIDAHGRSIYRIWTISNGVLKALQPNGASWATPSLARVTGTNLGAADIVGAYLAYTFPAGPFEQQYDAVLYLGPEERLTEAEIAPELCFDQEYLDMRLPRLRIAAEGGAPFLNEFEEYCDSVENRR
jgi:hypothetical protein